MFSQGQKVVWTPPNGGLALNAVVSQAAVHGDTSVVEITLDNGDKRVVSVGRLKAVAVGKTVEQLDPYAQRAIVAIREALRAGGNARAQLQSLLRGATRGPDKGQDGSNSLKSQTTAALRFLTWGPEGAHFGDCSGTREAAVQRLSSVSKAAIAAQHGEHFASNVAQAASVFGITLRP